MRLRVSRRARMIRGWTDPGPLFRTTSRMPCSGMTCLVPCDETSSERKTTRYCRPFADAREQRL